MRYWYLVVDQGPNGGGVHPIPDNLPAPLEWEGYGVIVVSAHNDIFQEGISHAFLGAVFGIVHICREMNFEFYTRNIARCNAWIKEAGRRFPHRHWMEESFDFCRVPAHLKTRLCPTPPEWPLPNLIIKEAIL